jgi:Phosphotransferase enzyme family
MRKPAEPACDETPPETALADTSSYTRGQAMLAFLKECGWSDLIPAVIAGDASFRRYYRLMGNGRRAVVMDAPPPQEDVTPYIAISKLLLELGLSAPEVLAKNDKDGFLLIEDFGDDTYTRLLNKGADEQALYLLAVDTLIELQRAVERRGALDLPTYDGERPYWWTGMRRRHSGRHFPTFCGRSTWKFGKPSCRKQRWVRIPWCCGIIMSTI